jgi:cell division protein FtsI/penicillin-binding protein 2
MKEIPGMVWWNRLVYGFPPAGRDIRTSIELKLQAKMDGSLQPYIGAAILVNAQTGEILAMSSHPTFDGNQLDARWKDLINDQDAPLVNRVVQGQYPLGGLSEGVFRQFIESGGTNPNPQIRLPVEQLISPQTDLTIASPLQIVLLSAAISNRGLQPAPLLVTAVNTEPDGWIILPR